MGASGSKQLPQGFEDLGAQNPEDLKQYNDAFEDGGMSGLKKQIDEDINKWKKEPVNIAVTGNSGVGKSSFINSFRGLIANQEGAAAVGIEETTDVPTKYVHPQNENIALWDLPGVGTTNFPRETYLQDVQFDTYDCFLLVTAHRFTENDLWLANEIRKQKKNVFIIYAQMDIDVAKDKSDNPSTDKDKTVDKIRKRMTTHLEKGGLQGVDVFLISNRVSLEFDFPVLIEKMIESVPKLKQEAMTLSLTNRTEDLINRKKAAMLKRIALVSLGSAVASGASIPGLSIAVDKGISIHECHFYRKQFGLDDNSLLENANLLHTSVEQLKANFSSIVLFEASEESIKNFLVTPAQLVIKEVAESVTKAVSPVVGRIIAASMSYGSTVAALTSILNAFVTDALQINHLLMEQLSTSPLVN